MDGMRFIVPICISAVFAFGAMIGPLVFMLYWDEPTCSTNVLQQTPSTPAGHVFKVISRNCGLNIFATYDVAVTAAKVGAVDETVIFEFDPWRQDMPLITMLDDRTVKISLDSASSISLSRESWQDLTVVYDIGYVAYPPPN